MPLSGLAGQISIVGNGPTSSPTYDPVGRLAYTGPFEGGGVYRDYVGNQLIGEAGQTRLRSYVPGPGTDETLTWFEFPASGPTLRRWLLADERGSTVAVTDATGAVIGRLAYNDYGTPAATNPQSVRFQYTGQQWLPEIGMHYYKNRIYYPQIGRFMQTDPIGVAGGTNLYAYVGGDPVNLVDPLGLCDKTYRIDEKVVAEFTSTSGCGGGGGGWNWDWGFGRAFDNAFPNHFGNFGEPSPQDFVQPIYDKINDAQRTARSVACKALSSLGSVNRTRFGADGALGAGGAIRGGAGLNADRSGAFWFDAYGGLGGGIAASIAYGVSIQYNASQSSQFSASGNLGGGFGPAGVNLQAGAGTVTGLGLGGSANVGAGTPLTGGKIGGEATLTGNAEINLKLTGSICPGR